MVDFRHPREMPGYLLPAVIAGLVIAILALGWVTYTTLQDLDRARADLSTAAATLATTETDLSAETDANAAANAMVADLTAKVNELQRAAPQQAECASQLGAELDELDRIRGLQRDNISRLAQTSRLRKAEAARDAATAAALSDRYNSYKSAFEGQRATANTWNAKANAQIKIANTNIAIIDVETKALNGRNKAIEDALAALSDRITATKAACSAGAGT